MVLNLGFRIEILKIKNKTFQKLSGCSLIHLVTEATGER